MLFLGFHDRYTSAYSGRAESAMNILGIVGIVLIGTGILLFCIFDWIGRFARLQLLTAPVALTLIVLGALLLTILN